MNINAADSYNYQSKEGTNAVLPDLWGQGQLFAFSALDGFSSGNDDFAGYLCGDKTGITFCTKKKRELVFSFAEGIKPVYKAVTGDYIRVENSVSTTPESAFSPTSLLRVLFVQNHLVAGECNDGTSPMSFVLDPKHTLSLTLSPETTITVHDTADGEYTALALSGNRFAFSFAHSANEARTLALTGLDIDIDLEERRKLEYYFKFSPKDSSLPAAYGKLRAKCLSVMKTQLYSPEREFTTIWSTPDRLPHKKLWLWDSVFHAIGFRHIMPKLSEDLIRAVFVHQREDGFIPHMAAIDISSAITQPPVIAFGALKVFEKTGNIDFLKEVYEHNKAFLEWLHTNRRYGHAANALPETEANADASAERTDTTTDRSIDCLYTWNTGSDVNCRCDESGMYNSPRFDCEVPLYAIDFCCFMVNDTEAMAQIASILGLSNEKAYYVNWSESIKAQINSTLWSEEDGFYFDYDIHANTFNKVWSVASFLPLFAGVCNKEQTERLIAHLTNRDEFWSELPVSSISKKDSTYGSDMWRGPVWINFNYMIIQGLKDYGYDALAKELTDKTIACINRWYESSGCIFEFFDCSDKKVPSQLNRKGLPYLPYDFNIRYQAIRDFGWSCTLLFDMLSQA